MRDDPRTTLVIQSFLDRLAVGAPPEPIVRELLGRSAERLRLICSKFLFHDYPRLTRPPVGLHTDEMLSAIVERLLKAMREVRPPNVRQFFALVNRHMRWELNDLARRLDQRDSVHRLRDSAVAPRDSTRAPTSAGTRRMLDAIASLPEKEREVFELLRIQGLSYTETAELLGVSESTVHRRLHRGLVFLEEALADLRPANRDA